MIHKREGQDIWRGLYEFPNIESESTLSLEDLENEICRKMECASSDFTIRAIAQKKQRLTHQLIHGAFYELNGDLSSIPGSLITYDKLKTLGVPKIISDFVSHHLGTLLK